MRSSESPARPGQSKYAESVPPPCRARTTARGRGTRPARYDSEMPLVGGDLFGHGRGVAVDQLFETVRVLLPGVLELTETPWRSEYLYAKAATLYGGTAEIQRDIIARRLLDLGRE
ncbi:acyl-CoA dehydrogenase family protein [Streptomyces sp. NPDC048254]|uniref:acyl-CoA dehydrogenase family protein n=1 Tax=Streptomyces sp. NPDC048254 TaxID=3365525 RepID=UPI00371B5086